MTNAIYKLYTASEIEDLLGKKYFYRQRVYRLASARKLVEFNRGEIAIYMGSHVISSFLKELELRIQDKFPEIDFSDLRIFYDTATNKRIVVDGLFGRGVSVDTDKENEEDLLKKIEVIVEWVGSSALQQNEENENEVISISKNDEIEEPVNVLPEEILWIRLDTGVIKGVEIKSFILVSLPSIAKFIGSKSDQFTEWMTQTSFIDFVLSLHSKKFNAPDISGSLKKGVVSGHIPLIPFELLPEIIVSYKQSGRFVQYPEKVELLYQLSKSTLEAVGLAISGNKDKAAEELAKVGLGLGLNAADQIIGLFKQYESRDFQIKTTREFQSKVKSLKLDYAITIGKLTVGITGKYPSQWKMLGTVRNLPKIVTNSSREVMRKLQPSDSVGMAFGEKSFVKDPNMNEAIETGRQGKNFYERLKKVGLLD